MSTTSSIQCMLAQTLSLIFVAALALSSLSTALPAFAQTPKQVEVQDTASILPLEQAGAIDPGPWFQFQPAATGDPGGNIHVTWTDFRDGTRHIRYTSMAPGEPWQASVKLDPTGTAIQENAHMTMDGKGNIYAIWLDERGIIPQVYFSTKPAGEAWSAGTPVSASTLVQYSPDIAVNTRGEVIVTWVQGMRPNATVMAAQRAANGAWSATEPVSPSGQIYNTSAAMMTGGAPMSPGKTGPQTRPISANVRREVLGPDRDHSRRPDRPCLVPAHCRGQNRQCSRSVGG